MTYRINLPVRALTSRGHRKAAVTIPAGRIVGVLGPAEDSRFVVAVVGGKQLDIVASDLAKRGTPFSTAAFPTHQWGLV